MRNRTSPGEGRWSVLLAAGAAAIAALLVAACGGAASGASSSTGSVGTGGSGGGGSTGGYALTMSLQDPSTKATLSGLNPGGPPANVVVQLTNGGAPVAGAVVLLTQSSGAVALVSITNPLSGQMVTDSTGKATFSIATTNLGSGGVSLTAAASVGSTSVNQTLGFNVGPIPVSGVQVTCLESSANFTGTACSNATVTMGSYSTIGLTATIKPLANATAPFPTTATVSFQVDTTNCVIGGGTATITTSVVANLVNGAGVASATLTDAGCARVGNSSGIQPVTVSALLNSSSAKVNVNINAPTTGSVKFVSVTPSGTSITLKGQSGAGRQSFATMTFTLVDVAGNPVPNYPVCFDATTYSGGLTIDSYNNLAHPPNVTYDSTGYVTNEPQCGALNTLGLVKNTDASGNVVVLVNAGTSPTPVRVRARTAYPSSASLPILETLSNLLTISTGLPIDQGMDLAVSVTNIDGRDYSGSTTDLTVRLADLFGNPVADGTQVNFVTSGGAVCTSGAGGCTTTNGSCSCTLTSEAYRPIDGRVVVMAYAIGLPDFVDNYNNYTFVPECTTPLPSGAANPKCPNGSVAGDTFYPLGDVFLDADKSGVYNAPPGPHGDNDQCFPYVNGAQCAPFPLNAPSTVKSNGSGVAVGTIPNTIYGPVYLRRSLVVFFSGDAGDSPTIVVPNGFTPVTLPAGTVTNGTLTCTQASVTLPFAVMDGYGNPMPAGTTLAAVATTNLAAAITTGLGTVPNVAPHAPNPTYDNPTGTANIPKTGSNVGYTSAKDPTLFPTYHSVNIANGSTQCAAGNTGYVQIQMTTTPTGSSGGTGVTGTACVVVEGQTITPGACRSVSIPVVYQ